MIVTVTGEYAALAGLVHWASWTQSHQDFCSPDFLSRHTLQTQTEHIRSELAAGKQMWMLIGDEIPLGIVSVDGNLIENLYVRPESQRRGVGSILLERAEAACNGVPRLWVLSNNDRAINFYRKHCYERTEKENYLSDTVWESLWEKQV